LRFKLYSDKTEAYIATAAPNSEVWDHCALDCSGNVYHHILVHKGW